MVRPSFEGTLALYTYEDTSYDSDGNRQTNYYHLLEMLQEARRSLHNMRQAVFFVALIYITIACVALPRR